MLQMRGLPVKKTDGFMSNFKELERGFNHNLNLRELHDIHEKLGNQQGIFRLFADVAELFLPQSVNTFLKMVGSEEDVVKPRQSGPDIFENSGYIPGGRG